MSDIARSNDAVESAMNLGTDGHRFKARAGRVFSKPEINVHAITHNYKLN